MQIILPDLLLKSDVLAVHQIRLLLILNELAQAVVKYLLRLCIQHNRNLLLWVSERRTVGDLGENFSQDGLKLLAFLFRLVMHL